LYGDVITDALVAPRLSLRCEEQHFLARLRMAPFLPSPMESIQNRDIIRGMERTEHLAWRIRVCGLPEHILQPNLRQYLVADHQPSIQCLGVMLWHCQPETGFPNLLVPMPLAQMLADLPTSQKVPLFIAQDPLGMCAKERRFFQQWLYLFKKKGFFDIFAWLQARFLIETRQQNHVRRRQESLGFGQPNMVAASLALWRIREKRDRAPASL